MTLTKKPYMTIQMSQIEGHRVWMEGVLEHSVDTETAVCSWDRTHESDAYHDRFFDAYHIIEEVCSVVCKSECRGVSHCPVSRETFHEILYKRPEVMEAQKDE